jgi:hypothetical protein
MQSCDIEIYSTPLVRGSPKPNKRGKKMKNQRPIIWRSFSCFIIFRKIILSFSEM